jgi:hypothetical protein
MGPKCIAEFTVMSAALAHDPQSGGLLEEQQRTQRKFASMNERELADILQRHGWEIDGPSPL